MADRTSRPDEPKKPFRPPTPRVIGIVGGVAAGKSTVAKLFVEHGIRHVDADRLAREAGRDPVVLAEIEDQLGSEFVVAGAMARERLAELVFSEPAKKAILEQILHPRIRSRILAELDGARTAGDSALLDVPLLFEAGLYELCDAIVFVAASEAVREARARGRGWDDDERARREQNQLPIAEKRARCHHVVDNDGTLAETAAAVAKLLSSLEQA